ncbi:MAG: DUF1800 family protein, partial [Candidatus Korobacteraceae bacterium]
MSRPRRNQNKETISRRPDWRGVAALVLVLLVTAGLYAAKKNKNAGVVDEQKRAQQALDRVTFGPRPGDIQTVTAMGVDKWIELQLYPEKIDDSAMQARLAPYRTLTMSSREMLLDFPPNPVVRAVMDGKLPMPRDPYRHAIYAAAIDRMEQKTEQKQNAAAANSGAAPKHASAPGSSTMNTADRA